MKKITSTFIFIVFTLGLFAQSFAIDLTNYGKQVILYQTELNKTANGKEYAKFVDSVIEKYKNDEKFLTELNNKFANLDTSSLKDKTLANTLNYLEARTSLALVSLQEAKSSDILNPTISISDQKVAEDKIIVLQANLIERGETLVSNIVSNFEKNYNRKETGNMKMNFELDVNNIQNKTSLEFNNYEAITNNFDSQSKGDFKLLFELLDGEKDMKLQLNSFLDFISKEGTLYFLLKDLNIIDEKNIEDFNEALAKLKDIASKNQYIKYEDVQSQQLFNILKVLNYKTILADTKATFNKPLLEAYKKDGDKYYLRPTKYACDSFKALANKFDPFYGTSCSDSQYSSLLKDMTDFGKFYLSIKDDITTIGYNGNTNNLEENEGYISFTDKIVEFYYSIKPNQKDNPGEHFVLQYKNKILTGELIFTSDKYDYINNKYVTSKYTFNLNGTVDSNNELSQLNLVYNGGNSLTGAFNITGNNFSFTHKNDSYTNKTDINITGKFDDTEFLTDLSSTIDVQNRGGTYNYDTLEYTYNDALTKVLDSKITINNKGINGTTNFYSNGNIVVKITSNGTYTKESFDLSNKIELSDELSNLILYGDGKTHKITGDFIISTDISSNKNNIYILLDVLDNGKTILKYEIDNKGQIQKDNVPTIPTPTNIIDFKDVFDLNIYDLNSYY